MFLSLFSCVKLLYEYKSQLSLSENDSDSPLHIACRCGHFELVKYLLSQGADLEIWYSDWTLVPFWVIFYSNSTEGTALACAAANGHEQIVSYLINNGASTSGGYYKNEFMVSVFIDYITKDCSLDRPHPLY